MVIPPHTEGCMISQAKDSRLLWLTVEGMLTEDFMRQMNALNRVPAKQGMLPSMVVLIRQIVQVLCATPAQAKPATSWDSCFGA